jgi:DNA-binding GntR family transcriptional regulator
MNEIKKIGTHLSLKDRVYESIKSQIIKGSLAPDRYLSESELSEAMNISRAPIREALNMLEKEGFVSIIPRKGTRVSKISKEEVQNIWEVRSILESYAARNASLKNRENELIKMEETLNKILQEPYDFSSYTSSDLKLHELLYKDLENKMLKEMIILARQNSLRILYYAQGTSVFNKNYAFLDTHEHLMIIEALRAHDPERSEAAVFLHIKNSKQRIIEALENRD